MEFGEPDDSGRRRPVPVAGSEFEFETDQIVFAIGTNANPIIGQTSHIHLNKRGYIGADETLATSIAGVFAGGDIVTGAATVIEAMGAGRKAARSMKDYLRSAIPVPTRPAGRRRDIIRNRSAGAQLRAHSRCLRWEDERDHSATAVKPRPRPTKIAKATPGQKTAVALDEHIVEIISDSGEGAQRCGQALAAIAARMGNGVWTVEIIPAEIRPPARSVAGGSGNRIRLGSGHVTNGGNETDLVVAFNEQVLLGRVRTGELKAGCTILLESMWRESADKKIAAAYVETHEQLVTAGYKVYRDADGARMPTLVADARRGKNMFALGMLCNIYSFDLQLAREQIARHFRQERRQAHQVERDAAGCRARLGRENLDFKYRIPATRSTEPQIVVNGNTALALGVLASGMEICAMYPITPATSVSHYLSSVFEKVGGIVHQAEDEIAACTFAIGASYAGKCAVTVTSGPGYSLKQEAIGLAVMGEIPLVVINVQRGGP